MTRQQILATIESLVGEGVHTGLRKLSDHPASATAWNAIQELPEKDWQLICQVTAEQIFFWLGGEKLLAPGVYSKSK